MSSSQSNHRKTQRTKGLYLAAAGALAALTAWAPQARADSETWDDGAADSLWQSVSNWSADTTFPGATSGFASTDTATFSTTGTTSAIDLGGTINVLSLIYGVSGGDAASFIIGDVDDTLNFTAAGGITINAGVTTAQTIGAATLNLSTAAAASTTFTNNGTGLLTITGNVAAQNASGAGVLNVAGSGNITITGTVTEPGVGNQALKKVGSGTLTLSNGSTWSGTGASQPLGAGTGGNSVLTAPMIVQEGTLLLNGGTHTVNGEVVIGGISGAHGGVGQNAKIQVDAGTLNIVNSWLSIGRGNGVGVATSDLELNNNALVTTRDMAAGFNGGNAANMPKGTITLNGTSILSVSNTVNFAESAGSNFTMNINDSATFRQTANTAQTKVGMSDGAVGVINVNGGTATFERDFILGAGGTGSGKLVLNSGTVNVATGTERWLKLNDSNSASTGRIDVNGGNLNLNTNTDLRFSTNGSASGTNVVNLNSGAISGYTGNNNGIFSGTSVVDLNQGSNQAAVNNTFNLNGGTLTIGQVVTSNNNGTAVFNFNGGTLRAAAASTGFFDLGGANQRANVRNGGAIIDTNGFDVTVAQALLHSNIGGDAATDGGLTKNGAGILTLTGASTYTGVTTINAGTINFNSTATYTGGVTGAGAVAVSGGLTSFGGPSSYSGATAVNAGTLVFLNTAAKPASSAVSVAAAATLGLGVGGAGLFSSADVDSLFANTMAGVTMNATSLVGIDTTAGDFTYATGQAGTNGLIKMGANTLTLSGNQSYSGTTAIAAGTLVLSGSNTNSGATMVNGGTLRYNDSAAMSGSSAITVANGGALSLNSDATNPTFTPGGNTVLSGGATFNVGNISSGSDQTITLAGTTQFNSGSTLNVTSSNGYSLTLNAVTTNGVSPTFSPAAGATLNIGNITNTAGTYAVFNFAGAGNTNVTGVITTSVLNRSVALVFNQAGTVTLSGNNWLRLNNNTSSNANTYVNVNSGTVNFNHANAINGSTAVPLNLNGGSIDNTSGAAITLNGPHAISIGANFAYGGTNDLNLGNNATTLNGAAGARTITTNGSATLTLPGVIANGSATGLTKAGSGVLELLGANTYTGGTSVSGGALRTGATGRFGTGTVTVSSSGTELQLGNANSIDDTAALNLDNGTTLVLNFSDASESVASVNFGGMLFNTATVFTAGDMHGVDSDYIDFVGSNASLTVVPEPSALALAGLMSAGLLARRRRVQK